MVLQDLDLASMLLLAVIPAGASTGRSTRRTATHHIPSVTDATRAKDKRCPLKPSLISSFFLKLFWKRAITTPRKPARHRPYFARRRRPKAAEHFTRDCLQQFVATPFCPDRADCKRASQQRSVNAKRLRASLARHAYDPTHSK